jgi:hypothetical protein
VSVVYNCYWPSLAQLFSSTSPAGLMAIFYWVRFETIPTCRARTPYLYPPGTGCRYTPRHWVPSSSLPTARSATVEVSESASTRETAQQKSKSKSNSKILYDWWFIANQYILAPSSLRPRTRDYSFQLIPWGISPW